MKDNLNDFQIRTYLYQIEQQCNYAFEALKLMNLKLDNENLNPKNNLSTEMYFLATNFVISVANIHKLIVGTGHNRKRSVSQNEFTKKRILSLKVHFDALVKKLPNRSIRNSLEHFDERLDDAIMSPATLFDHNILIVNNYDDHKDLIVAPNAITLRQLIVVRTSRKFYFEFSNDKICLNDIELILREIVSKCQELRRL